MAGSSGGCHCPPSRAWTARGFQQGFRAWFRFRSRSKAQHGAGRHGAGAGESDADEAEEDVSDEASRFPMGYGAVAVPVRCEVAAVKAVLQAADYYQVRGMAAAGLAYVRCGGGTVCMGWKL